MNDVTPTSQLKQAERYLDGEDLSPEKVLALYDALAINERVIAPRLARELATRVLRGSKRITDDQANQLWEACKQSDAFGLARRLIGRSRKGSPQIVVTPHHATKPSESKLRQQHALCTSKDPDLSASMRHDWAIAILSPNGDPDDPETQGIAGGIWKRRWEWDGDRSSLERSLEHYRRGLAVFEKEQDPKKLKKAGYVAVNCAFGADLLASLMPAGSPERELLATDADRHRDLVIQHVPPSDRWNHASRAEAFLGRGDIGNSVTAMKLYASENPAPWEVDSTMRQLVRLGQLRRIADADVARVLTELLAPGRILTASDPRLTSLLLGRVGLALSGGGFRASLYHIGVLARLAEADVLRHVEVLSCVSGGSIVGPLYYLAIREEIQAKGDELVRDDYVRVVKRVQNEFVVGVAENVRTRVLAKFKDCYAIVNGDDVAYANCVSGLFHDTFYKGFVDKDVKLSELAVNPRDADPHFHPGRHNWTRRNKVPALVLNAATLNTGHAWQFTTSSMGESPFSIDAAVDSNERLRRARYYPQLPHRSVRLRDAVAASACVPGLFAPMQLDHLYDGYEVRLVDGGVFDNQGAVSLIEQDCQILFVSDASGQLGAARAVEGGHLAPLLRAVAVFQERVRQATYDGLRKRCEAGQVRGLAYVHLTQGLRVAPVDWTKCEDPHQPNDQLPEDVLTAQAAGYGVTKELQALIANMRTDLDVFSEVECATLMASGYGAMDAELRALLARVPALPADDKPEEWFFTPVVPIVRDHVYKPKAYEQIKAHLSAGASPFGRLTKLNRSVFYIALTLGVLLLPLALVLIWLYRAAPLLTLGGLTVAVVAFIASSLIGNWAAFLIDPRRALRTPLRKLVGATVLWVFANVALRKLDPLYRRGGELKTLQ